MRVVLANQKRKNILNEYLTTLMSYFISLVFCVS